MVTVTEEKVHAQQVSIKNVFCMEGGQGASSYMNNSQMQSRTIQSLLHVLKGTLDNLQLPSLPEKFLTAADLGCSCGQNTLDIAEFIVQHIFEQYGSRGQAAPELCFYFSDLPTSNINDFNTLFRLLQDSTTTDNGSRRRYFAAGVPGSFYGRLFPEKSINVFTCTFSLHWLSQVPREVEDKRSAAYNKGKLFVHGAPEATGLAYKKQFQFDLGSFLHCRATELRSQGALFVVCVGRPSSFSPTDQGNLGSLHENIFQDSWDDIVREGLMDDEKTDSFNIPLYAPTLEEFREAVDANGSFRINLLDLVTGSAPVIDCPDDPGAIGCTVANNARSVHGVLVEAHIGRALSGEVFRRLQCRAEERAEELMEGLRFPYVVCSLSLI
ncbi:unnamed protein product [Urochloa humidicola]